MRAVQLSHFRACCVDADREPTLCEQDRKEGATRRMRLSKICMDARSYMRRARRHGVSRFVLELSGWRTAGMIYDYLTLSS